MPDRKSLAGLRMCISCRKNEGMRKDEAEGGFQRRCKPKRMHLFSREKGSLTSAPLITKTGAVRSLWTCWGGGSQVCSAACECKEIFTSLALCSSLKEQLKGKVNTYITQFTELFTYPRSCWSASTSSEFQGSTKGSFT